MTQDDARGGSEQTASSATTTTLQLVNLPEEVLLEIFSYCDSRTLTRLARVSKSFNRLASADCLWSRLYRCLTVIDIVKNEGIIDDMVVDNDDLFLDTTAAEKADDGGDSCSNLRFSQPLKEKCRIGLNWQKGTFVDRRVIREDIRQMPHIQSVDDHMFVSSENNIHKYQSLKNGTLKKWKKLSFSGHQKDVTDFVCKENLLVSADVKGVLCGWNSNTAERIFRFQSTHLNEVNAIDFHDKTVISGSKDSTVQIWTMKNNSLQWKKTLDMQDKVWALSISPCGQKLVCGTSGFEVPSCRIWDLERSETSQALLNSPRVGAGVLDVQFDPKSPHLVLGCGYDTCIHIWDLRTGQIVREWEEPFDMSVYCVKAFGDYSVVSGTARHGMARLWDKRMDQSIQMFYPRHRPSGSGLSSPVYSLDYNANYLYLALDRGVYLADFTVVG